MICSLDLHTKVYKINSPRTYWKYVKKNKLLGTAILQSNLENPKRVYLELLKYKPRDKVLIPGITINTDCGDVLIYGSNSDLYDYGILYEHNISIKRICDFCEKKGFLISIAHPFGTIQNSATYLMGLSKLEKFIKSKNIGVEAFNGQIGYLSYYLYDSFFLRKLRGLLDFFIHDMQLPFVSRICENMSHKLDQKSYDLVYKFSAAIKLGQMAKFVTAGSGTPFMDRMGSGILVLDLPKTIVEEEDSYKQNKAILDRIYNKKIKAVGPPGKYTDDLFERSTARITKKKAYSDLMYLTKRSIK